MIIYEAFKGDNNKLLANVQHDLWFKKNHCWVENDGRAMSGCFFFFAIARKAFLSGTSENPLFFPEREQLIDIERFDHHALQDAYQIIADQYRWTQHKAIPPVFADSEEDYLSFLLESWILFLKHELAMFTFRNLAVAELIVRAVIFQNTDKGYEAENELRKFLTERYSEYMKALPEYGV